MTLTKDQLASLSETDVRNPIPPEELLPALTSPPFIPSTSLINVRDLGAVPGSAILSGLAYRCGTLELAATDPQALAWLSASNERAPDPQIDGVENIWFDSTSVDLPPVLDEFVEGGGEVGLRKEYLKVLDIYRRTFYAVLEHIRDRPGEPFLFHCTAGRDRTGVLAGILQSLAGTAPDDRLLRYARVGTGTTADDEHPGFYNMCSLRTSCWDAFVAGVEDTYGGWDGYVTRTLGFSTEDLEIIKLHLREGNASKSTS
ncbi:Tyrosine-protein phosphatase [Colletotrichum siamense]|uniref:Tyrosine-protein phosphatase n=1 Tax=Colletotrichum siamense TaxID=690259 RepID=A0A9P5ECT7_COLSI|nr:Tyrosine-protein phosphatase [Colletotrichum siamense]KAF4842988.1 Tyrosine-protein phosphatase [Colletotrichum siamense]